MLFSSFVRLHRKTPDDQKGGTDSQHSADVGTSKDDYGGARIHTDSFSDSDSDDDMFDSRSNTSSSSPRATDPPNDVPEHTEDSSGTLDLSNKYRPYET